MRERESLTHGTPWVTSKLGDLCTVKTGKLNANAAVEGGEYPFFTCSKQDYRIDQYSFDGEALLISGNGDVGNVKYYNGKFDAYQRTYVLMGFKLDARYLYYYLKESMPKRARDMLNGSAVPYIKLNCITDFEISYPEDIEEQKKIAQVLSDLDELANLHNLKVAELVKMKESLMDNKSGIIENEKNKQENNEWVTVKLKDVCDFTKGKNPQDYNEDGLGRPIVSAPEIESTLGNTTYAKFTDENLPDCVRDDILLLWDGSRAGVSGFNHEAILSSTIMRLRVKDKNSFYPKLIYYMLTVNKSKISSNRTGSAIPHLNRQVVEDLTFDLPRNIEEQKRIAKMLSEYDSMVASQEQLISIIQRERVYASSSSDNHQSPKWRTVKIKDIIKISSGSFVKKDLQVDDGEYPVYNGGISNTGYYTAFNVKGPKVVLSSRGASAGYVNLVKTDFWAGNSCYVMNILNDEEVDIEYLYYIMKCNESKLSDQKVQGAIPAVNMSQVYELEIDLPDIKEQKRIASILKDYDKMLNSQEKLIELIQRESLCVKFLR